MVKTSRKQMLWSTLVVFLAGTGLFSLAVQLIPYRMMKPWVDLLATDGSVDSFTPTRYSQFKFVIFPVGLILLLATAWLFRNRRDADRLLSDFSSFQRAFIASRVVEIHQLWGALWRFIEDVRYSTALLVIVAFGVIYRAAVLSKPVSHDEAYTYVAFVSMGLKQVLTDYHLPNNHVFHSFLVLLSTELFGIQPWAIRFPAFIAGILIIPATYFVARTFYGKQTALVGAAWAASMPALISYSANARGYSLVSLFTLLLVAAGAYLKENRNLAGWGAFILLASLGFYTIPIMLYPFGLVVTWLILAALFRQVGPDYGDDPFKGLVIRYLLPACMAIVLIVILLYSPILINSGMQSVFGGSFNRPLDWPVFLETIQARINNTWKEWNTGLPQVVSYLFVVGLCASFLIAVVKRPARIPLFIPAALWIGSLLVLQRVAPWPRVWIFLLPLVLISSAAGLVAIARFIAARLPNSGFLFNALFAACLVVPLAAKSVDTIRIIVQSEGQFGSVERVALFLKGYLESDDVILVTTPDAVITKYYLARYGVQGNFSIVQQDKEFRRALAIVNLHQGQSLDYVLGERASRVNFELDAAKIVYQVEDLLVYELELPPGSGN